MQSGLGESWDGFIVLVLAHFYATVTALCFTAMSVRGIRRRALRLLTPISYCRKAALYVTEKADRFPFFQTFFATNSSALGLGLYVDCDVYCLRPIEDADYILGWQGRNSLANAVLKLPPDCPVLAALRAIKDTPNFVPPSFGRRKRRLEWLRGPAPAIPLEDLPWATASKALAYYAHLHGIDHLASQSIASIPLTDTRRSFCSTLL